MSPIYVVASANMDPLHLRIHDSTSLCLRLLCKIHVSGFMSQHPCVSQDPLQDPCCRIHSSAALCISGSSTRSTSSDSCLSIFVSHGFSARSTSPDTCLNIHLYLRILCKIHVSGSMCQIDVLASTNMDPLQDPCLRIHVSASLYLRILYKIHVFGYMSQHPLIWILCKIHVFGFMSQHLYISGSSARSISPDPYISIHMSQDPLQDPCVRFMSQQVLAFMSQHPCVSQDPLQDPRLRIHVSASLYLTDSLQDPRLRIHVSASVYISGSSARSMSPDPCVRFMSQYLCISGSSAISMSPDPYINIHMYLWILCKIHVSGIRSQHPYVS